MARRFTIGRDRACDIPIADDSVSRLHAEIWLADDGALMLADRGSSNGTTLLRGQESYPLRVDVILPGDQIRFGRALLAVQDLVNAIEIKYPRALTPEAVPSPPEVGGKASPSINPAKPPAVPPRVAPPIIPAPPPSLPPPSVPPPPAMPTAQHTSPSPLAPSGQAMAVGKIPVRCVCGAVKLQGSACSACGQ